MGSATFDQYGVYFGVAGDVVELYKSHGGVKVAQLEEKATFTDLRYRTRLCEKSRFGPKNEFIVAGTAEGTLKLFK